MVITRQDMSVFQGETARETWNEKEFLALPRAHRSESEPRTGHQQRGSVTGEEKGTLVPWTGEGGVAGSSCNSKSDLQISCQVFAEGALPFYISTSSVGGRPWGREVLLCF